MADATSEVTVDTGEWAYVDSTGVQHPVTNGETFDLLISDDGDADVQHNFVVAGSVATDDGYVVDFQPIYNTNNDISQIAVLTDAGQGSAFLNLRGEMTAKCSVNGVVQNWTPATYTPSDADYASAGTIAATWEDQFGNKMSWAAGMTVGQAA